MNGSDHAACPVCAAADLTPCLEIPRVPVYCNVLHASREAALRAATGAMDLLFCGHCGHLHNAAFDRALVDYSGEYENSLHHSPRFRDYAEGLARELSARHGLRGKTVVEIASGQGDFLRTLAAVGGSRGIGFDPAYRGPAGQTDGVEIIADHYSDHHARRHADLLVCRHALEHLPDPAGFLRMVRSAVAGDATAVFFEVPDARFTLRDLGIWDLIYEHCGYFSRESLIRVFRDAGFRVDGIETAFGDQFLCLHGHVAGAADAGPAEPPGPELAGLVERFATAYRVKVEQWADRLTRLRAAGLRTVLWGAGSKGVSFVNSVAGSDAVEALVDLNPHKHGRFVAGSGHPVIAPERLRELRPDRVILMNPVYREEIAASLATLGLDKTEILLDSLG